MLHYSESFKVWVKLIFSFKTFSWLCWNLQLPLSIFVHDAGGSLLPHPGRHVALGQHGLLPHGLRPVPRYERLGALPDRLHHREVHRHLSPHEGPGEISLQNPGTFTPNIHPWLVSEGRGALFKTFRPFNKAKQISDFNIFWYSMVTNLRLTSANAS